MSHLGSIQGREERSSKPTPGSLARTPSNIDTTAEAAQGSGNGEVSMMAMLWAALMAPVGLYLLFGLLHVLLPPPYDKKALAILKLRPNVPSQIINLIRSMLQKGS
jgi:hypothetical protein